MRRLKKRERTKPTLRARAPTAVIELGNARARALAARKALQRATCCGSNRVSCVFAHLVHVRCDQRRRQPAALVDVVVQRLDTARRRARGARLSGARARRGARTSRELLASPSSCARAPGHARGGERVRRGLVEGCHRDTRGQLRADAGRASAGVLRQHSKPFWRRNRATRSRAYLGAPRRAAPRAPDDQQSTPGQRRCSAAGGRSGAVAGPRGAGREHAPQHSPGAGWSCRPRFPPPARPAQWW